MKVMTRNVNVHYNIHMGSPSHQRRLRNPFRSPRRLQSPRRSPIRSPPQSSQRLQNPTRWNPFERYSVSPQRDRSSFERDCIYFERNGSPFEIDCSPFEYGDRNPFRRYHRQLTPIQRQESNHREFSDEESSQRQLGHARLGHRQLSHLEFSDEESSYRELSHRQLRHQELNHRQLSYRLLNDRESSRNREMSDRESIQCDRELRQCDRELSQCDRKLSECDRELSRRDFRDTSRRESAHRASSHRERSTSLKQNFPRRRRRWVDNRDQNPSRCFRRQLSPIQRRESNHGEHTPPPQGAFSGRQRRRWVRRRPYTRFQLSAYSRKIRNLIKLRRTASKSLLQSLNGEIRAVGKLSRSVRGFALNRSKKKLARRRRRRARSPSLNRNEMKESQLRSEQPQSNGAGPISDDEDFLNEPDVFEFME